MNGMQPYLSLACGRQQSGIKYAILRHLSAAAYSFEGLLDSVNNPAACRPND